MSNVKISKDKMDEIYKENASALWEDDWLVGDWSGKRCPECGAGTLKNKNGDLWCSFVGCDWGLNA